MTIHTRTAPREQLIAELEEFADHREAQGKHERASGARAAAAELAAGADQVTFERAVHVVGAPGHGSVVRMPRAELIAEVKEAALGWAHNGKRGLTSEAVCAVEELESGAERAYVGHLVYEVAPQA